MTSGMMELPDGLMQPFVLTGSLTFRFDLPFYFVSTFLAGFYFFPVSSASYPNLSFASLHFSWLIILPHWLVKTGTNMVHDAMDDNIL